MRAPTGEDLQTAFRTDLGIDFFHIRSFGTGCVECSLSAKTPRMRRINYLLTLEIYLDFESLSGSIPLRNLNRSLLVDRTRVVLVVMIDLYASMVRVNS